MSDAHPDWLPLESCICGLCFECPDGYHTRADDDEGGCSCTADCALEDDEECDGCHEPLDSNGQCENRSCLNYRHPGDIEKE